VLLVLVLGYLLLVLVRVLVMLVVVPDQWVLATSLMLTVTCCRILYVSNFKCQKKRSLLEYPQCTKTSSGLGCHKPYLGMGRLQRSQYPLSDGACIPKNPTCALKSFRPQYQAMLWPFLKSLRPQVDKNGKVSVLLHQWTWPNWPFCWYTDK